MNNSASICPLCGQLNQCAQAGATAPVANCWCFAKQIAPEILEKIPPTVDLRCICPNCANVVSSTQGAVQPAITKDQE